MKGCFKFKNGISGSTQEAEHQNATQTTLGEDKKSIAIAITPAFPLGVDPLDHRQVKAYLDEAFAPLVSKGFVIDVKYGDFD